MLNRSAAVAHRRVNGLWVFGYGSLMWRPDFEFERQVLGRCAGVRRSFCVWSVFHRGSVAAPGLVLGLESGGMCEGMLFYVPPPQVEGVIKALREREQITNVYRETYQRVELMDGSGQVVSALCFVADRSHPQFALGLSCAQKAEVIKRARGRSGHNLDYLAQTLKHLRELGVRDDAMEHVFVMTRSTYKFGPSLAARFPCFTPDGRWGRFKA